MDCTLVCGGLEEAPLLQWRSGLKFGSREGAESTACLLGPARGKEPELLLGTCTELEYSSLLTARWRISLSWPRFVEASFVAILRI